MNQFLKNPPKESLIPCRGANSTWLPCLRRRNQEKLLWRLITGPIFGLQACDSSTDVAPQTKCCLFQNIELIVVKWIWDTLRCVPVCLFFHSVCVVVKRFKKYHNSKHEGGKKLLNPRKSGIYQCSELIICAFFSISSLTCKGKKSSFTC